MLKNDYIELSDLLKLDYFSKISSIQGLNYHAKKHNWHRVKSSSKPNAYKYLISDLPLAAQEELGVVKKEVVINKEALRSAIKAVETSLQDTNSIMDIDNKIDLIMKIYDNFTTKDYIWKTKLTI